MGLHRLYLNGPDAEDTGMPTIQRREQLYLTALTALLELGADYVPDLKPEEVITVTLDPREHSVSMDVEGDDEARMRPYMVDE